MNAYDTIKGKVARGLVLDIKGNWVTIASLKTVERNVLMHLEAGEVLHEGKWTGIKNSKTEKAAIPAGGWPPAPKTDQIEIESNDAEHIANKKAVPWTVISLSTGEQQSAPEGLLPMIRDFGQADDDSDDTSNSWEKPDNSRLKIIALISAATIILSIVIFFGIRLAF